MYNGHLYSSWQKMTVDCRRGKGIFNRTRTDEVRRDRRRAKQRRFAGERTATGSPPIPGHTTGEAVSVRLVLQGSRRGCRQPIPRRRLRSAG